MNQYQVQIFAFPQSSLLNIPNLLLSCDIAIKESTVPGILPSATFCQAKSELLDDAVVGEASQLELELSRAVLMADSSCCFLNQLGRPWKSPRVLWVSSSRGISCLNLHPVWVKAHLPSWIHMSQYTLFLLCTFGFVATMRSIWF